MGSCQFVCGIALGICKQSQRCCVPASGFRFWTQARFCEADMHPIASCVRCVRRCSLTRPFATTLPLPASCLRTWPWLRRQRERARVRQLGNRCEVNRKPWRNKSLRILMGLVSVATCCLNYVLPFPYHFLTISSPTISLLIRKSWELLKNSLSEIDRF